MSYEFLPPLNFLGLLPEHSARDTSRVVLLPVPYEQTTSYGQGTRNGPRALLLASQQVELYDREWGSEPALEYGVHTLPMLAPSYRDPATAHAEIAAAVAEYARDALLCVVGGEHSISGAVARGLARRCMAILSPCSSMRTPTCATSTRARRFRTLRLCAG